LPSWLTSPGFGLLSMPPAGGHVNQALREISCGRAELALPGRPSDYRRMLQAYPGYDLVIAGSFLLTDPVVDVARANPTRHFMLVDPIVMPPDVPNLAVLTFRSDQAAFLAGTLAGMITQTGVVAGVYGPQGAMDVTNRAGFEHGARYARPDVRVVGAYQPAGGTPYENPAWGAGQARAFSQQHADVIFGAGGTTGQGALLGAAQSGIACIDADIVASSDPGCLVASSMKYIDRGVQVALADVIGGPWRSGLRSLGLAQSAVGLSLRASPRLTPEIQRRLQTIADLLADGPLTTDS
jgi:basic membrane protein A